MTEDDVRTGSDRQIVTDAVLRDERARRRRLLALLGTGLAVVLTGWWQSSTPFYCAGLVIVAVAVAKLLAERRLIAALAVVTLLGAGVGGPWLGVRLAYSTGSDPAHRLMSAVLAEDGRTWAVDAHGLLMLDVDGTRLWHRPPARGLLVPLSVDRLLVQERSGGAAVVLDDRGAEVWSSSWDEADNAAAVAGDGEVLVERLCPEDGPCTWTGRSVIDGAELWEVTGERASEARVLDPVDFDDHWQRLTSEWFATGEADGTVALRLAATGEEVHRVAASTLVARAGDVVLAFDRQGCMMQVVRATGAPGPVPVDCLLIEAVRDGVRDGAGWDDVNHKGAGQPYLVRQGDVVAVVGELGASHVIELETAQARVLERDLDAYERFLGGDDPGYDRAVVGAQAQVDVAPEEIVVRDLATGERRWAVPVPAHQVLAVWARDDRVVVQRAHRPLLLHEVFAREDDQARTVEVYDAHSGERRAAVRTQVSGARASGEPYGVGSRVYLRLLTSHDGQPADVVID